MVDVVFLLLVFFMLAARFGQDLSFGAKLGGTGAGYSGPPRLVSVSEGGVQLNGFVLPLEDLAEELRALMAGPEDIVVLRPVEGATTQDLIDVVAALRAGGIEAIAVVE
ncbi:MAG: biopolymer transporter ExbD, partial [Pseudomonadota bacterium]